MSIDTEILIDPEITSDQMKVELLLCDRRQFSKQNINSLSAKRLILFYKCFVICTFSDTCQNTNCELED